MGEAIHKINEKLLDMHTEIVNRTHFLNVGQNPNDMLEIINFVKIVYHDTYDVWRASSLSNEYYYNLLCSLEKYVCAISFYALMRIEEEYEDLRCVFDDLIVFLQEEYDFSNYITIADELQAAPDVFSAALVIPVNNIYSRLVELMQVFNMVVKKNFTTPVEDSMFSLNVNKYYAMNRISPNMVVIEILSYSRYTGEEARRKYFPVPDMDPEEPGFDDFVKELGGAYDDRVVSHLLKSRGRHLVRNINIIKMDNEESLDDNELLNFDAILEYIAASLFILFILKDLPIRRIVGSLLELLKLIYPQDFTLSRDQQEVDELLLDVIYLTKELILKDLGISSIDEMFNYARFLRLMKSRVWFPEEQDATLRCGRSFIFRGVTRESTETKMKEFKAMDVRSYNTLNEVVVFLDKTECSLCKTSHIGETFGLCVNCPHLLCLTCLEYWINKSCTLTCPVCRELMPKLYFGQDFEVLKKILCSTGRQSAYIEKEFNRILVELH